MQQSQRATEVLSTASGQASKAGHAVRVRTAKTRARPRKMSKLIFSGCHWFSPARKLSLRHSGNWRKLFEDEPNLGRPVVFFAQLFSLEKSAYSLEKRGETP